MMRTSAGRIAKAVVLPVLALALAAGLTACQPGPAPVSGASGPAVGSVSDGSPGDPVSASGDTTSTPAGQSSNVGSVSVSVSSPVVVSGTAPTSVTCVTGQVYRAFGSRTTIRGNELWFTVAIVGYRGAGRYPAVVAVTLRQVSGLVTPLASVSRVAAVITATGGSFTVSAIGREGRTFTGSLTWVCGT